LPTIHRSASRSRSKATTRRLGRESPTAACMVALYVHIWHAAGGLCVALEPLSRGTMRLTTAFYVQSDMRRQEMKRKYAARVR